MVRVVNYKHYSEGKDICNIKSESSIYHNVMRGYSYLANPFKIKPWGPYERGQTIEMYRNWLKRRIALKDKEILEELQKLLAHLKSGKELSLVCCCSEQNKCHADIIKQVLEEMYDE